MEIRRTTIHQVYLLRFDEIPLLKLLHPAGVKSLSGLFGFAQSGVAQDQSGAPMVNLQLGAYQHEGVDISITRLSIEDRRILLDVEGTSEQADKITEGLREHLRSVSGRADEQFLKSIVKAQESEIVAQLEFSADQLLSEHLLRFVGENLIPATSSDLATSSAKLGAVLFVVQYDPHGVALDDFRISLSRKEFSIGPRPGSPLEERTYVSKAPVDTATHLSLLATLESILVHK